MPPGRVDSGAFKRTTQTPPTFVVKSLQGSEAGRRFYAWEKDWGEPVPDCAKKKKNNPGGGEPSARQEPARPWMLAGGGWSPGEPLRAGSARPPLAPRREQATPTLGVPPCLVWRAAPGPSPPGSDARPSRCCPPTAASPRPARPPGESSPSPALATPIPGAAASPRRPLRPRPAPALASETADKSGRRARGGRARGRRQQAGRAPFPRSPLMAAQARQPRHGAATTR